MTQIATLHLVSEAAAVGVSLACESFNERQCGNLGKAHQLFGGDLNALMNEFNEVLAP